jgi:Bacterial Ig-like domain (group 3)/NHL repeat
VVVDPSGNLYISDFNNDRIIKETFLEGAYVQSVYPTFGLLGDRSIALDASGDLYLADTFNQTVWKSSPAGGNFGPFNVGTASGVGYLLFSFTGTGTLSVQGGTALTQGATGLDYSATGTGNCAGPGVFNPGDSCALGVQFTALLPGQRLGAGELLDSSDNILVTGYMTGSGVGPQVNFQPPTSTLVAESETLNPQGIAVDASGNVYFADFANDQVLKVTPLGAQTTVADSTSGMRAPEAVAVDGAGNVYIADSANNEILEATPSAGSYTIGRIGNECVNQLRSPSGVAVDAFGNVFVADTNDNRVVKETPLGDRFVQSVIPTSGLAMPFAVAVDVAGNLYIADLTNNRIVLETLSGGVYTQSTIVTGLSEPTSVFVDVNGNVYIADYGSGRILKETLSAGAYTQSEILNVNGMSFYGVALDGGGNLYGTDVTGNLVFKIDFVDPPALSFDSTNVGTQSSDSPQVVTILNFGNADLSLPIPDSGTNPHFSAGSYTLDVSTTCPQVLSIGPAGVLAANVDCVYAIDFSPMTIGSNSDALALVDNSLNAANAIHTVSVGGTGLTASGPVATAITLTALPVATSPFGQSVTLTATLAPFAGGGQSTNGDLVIFKNGATSLGSGTLASGVASLSLTTLPAGVDSLTATFAGDLNFTASVSSALSYTVTRVTPAITWATPAQITFGTALSATQLDATSLVAGTFAYTPAAGTIPAGGMDTLSVTLSPTDTTAYNTATATVTLAVYDVGLSVSGSAASQTVTQGAAATFPFTAAPQGATTFVNPVTFSVIGLPPGATAVFTPATIPTGSASTPVSLVVQTAAATAGVLSIQKPPRLGPLGNVPAAFALLLLPFLGLQALRRRLHLRTSTRAAVLLATLIVAAVAALGGCTGSTSARSTSYPLVVTATSGTLHTSFNMTLIVNK